MTTLMNIVPLSVLFVVLFSSASAVTFFGSGRRREQFKGANTTTSLAAVSNTGDEEDRVSKMLEFCQLYQVRCVVATFVLTISLCQSKLSNALKVHCENIANSPVGRRLIRDAEDDISSPVLVEVDDAGTLWICAPYNYQHFLRNDAKGKNLSSAPFFFREMPLCFLFTKNAFTLRSHSTDGAPVITQKVKWDWNCKEFRRVKFFPVWKALDHQTLCKTMSTEVDAIKVCAFLWQPPSNSWKGILLTWVLSLAPFVPKKVLKWAGSLKSCVCSHSLPCLGTR